MRGVEKWRNNLDFNQSLDIHDSESPLITLGLYNAEYESSLENLVDPNDSASNVVGPSTISNTENRVYDINDPELLNLHMNDDSVDIELIDNIHYVVNADNKILLSIDPTIYELFI